MRMFIHHNLATLIVGGAGAAVTAVLAFIYRGLG